ncbi:helicase-related protein [Flavihumibacter sp.]|uniref:helicase-related protein n=1 Tax=Flavihumibacter sp. TaxID=1913981 RepID=UPI002FCAB2EE
MSWNYKFLPAINLHVKDRIQEADADRQRSTAESLLLRLETMPGQILADEVGMGKTFVALAVAVSVALQDKDQRPVVIMIPPGLKEKWPKDLGVFLERCLDEKSRAKVRWGIAGSNVEFLKLLDDDPAHRKNIIFLTHSALTRSLTDKWLKLAIIQRALYRRKDERIPKMYNRLNRFGSQIFGLQGRKNNNENLILDLLEKDTSKWKKILIQNGLLDEGADDPVPAQIIDILYKDLSGQDFNKLLEVLYENLPAKNLGDVKSRIKDFRYYFNEEVKTIWGLCLTRITHSIPLLVMDEAHHLKNGKTNIARLFYEAESDEDINDGQLHAVFERMLFLTATPFQLGHHELCNVLDRFKGINWQNALAAGLTPEWYGNDLLELRKLLDSTQEAAVRFDQAWGQLNPNDLVINEHQFDDVEQWWLALQGIEKEGVSPVIHSVRERYDALFSKMKLAESHLRKYVLRHMREREFTGEYKGVMRRFVFPGSAINNDSFKNSEGLQVGNGSLLPFLLAARLSSLNPEARPVFAEGLASSYEAFLYTRKKSWDIDPIDMDDDHELIRPINNGEAEWYLKEIETLISTDGKADQHPKLSATVNKVIDLWSKGEKVLVFCHYLATGDSLRLAVSRAIRNWIDEKASQILGCSREKAEEELTHIGSRFDEGYRMRTLFDDKLRPIIHEYDDLKEYTDQIMGVILRYFRTPAFLTRYFPLGVQDDENVLLDKAFEQQDASGLSLLKMIRNFLSFLAIKCGEEERKKYLQALSSIQTGEIRIGSAETGNVLPNVRLVNGSTIMETRQNLMLTFNTPFYPDILIATSVMSEGVDLHLNCRHIIHHDLCWNPSTLEQRTGRIDRIGAKAEQCSKPIHIYHPYVAATQDEKMYSVVMDRERWFNILMGENYKEDLESTDKLAERVPLPEVIVKELAFKLEVTPPQSSHFKK